MSTPARAATGSLAARGAASRTSTATVMPEKTPLMGVLPPELKFTAERVKDPLPA